MLDVMAKLFRGLGDTSRLRALAALRDGPLRVGDVVARTGLSQPNASMHLKCLGECGLVTWTRDGRFVHYEIADKRVITPAGPGRGAPPPHRAADRGLPAVPPAGP